MGSQHLNTRVVIDYNAHVRTEFALSLKDERDERTWTWHLHLPDCCLARCQMQFSGLIYAIACTNAHRSDCLTIGFDIKQEIPLFECQRKEKIELSLATNKHGSWSRNQVKWEI